MILTFYDIVVTKVALLLCSQVTKHSTSGPCLGFLADSFCFGLATIPFIELQNLSFQWETHTGDRTGAAQPPSDTGKAQDQVWPVRTSHWP